MDSRLGNFTIQNRAGAPTMVLLRALANMLRLLMFQDDSSELISTDCAFEPAQFLGSLGIDQDIAPNEFKREPHCMPL